MTPRSSRSQTIADTSAWVEYLRGLGGEASANLKLLWKRGDLAITEPIALEVLAGALDLGHERRLRRQLSSVALIGVGGLDTWEDAARVYRACRRHGFTPRSQLDCLISAVAIREDLPVLHADRDFDLIARHTSLRVAAA